MVGVDKYEDYQIHFVVSQRLDGVKNEQVVKNHQEKWPQPRRALKVAGVKYIYQEWKKKQLPWPQPDGSWIRVSFDQFKQLHRNKKSGTPSPHSYSSPKNSNPTSTSTANRKLSPSAATLNSPKPAGSSRVPLPGQPRSPPRAYSGSMGYSQPPTPRFKQSFSPAPSPTPSQKRSGPHTNHGNSRPALQQSTTIPETATQVSGYPRNPYYSPGNPEQPSLPPGNYSNAPPAPRASQHPAGQFGQYVDTGNNAAYHELLLQRQSALQSGSPTLQNIPPQGRSPQPPYDARTQNMNDATIHDILNKQRSSQSTSTNQALPSTQQGYPQYTSMSQTTPAQHNFYAVQNNSPYQSAFSPQSAPQIQRNGWGPEGYQPQRLSPQQVSSNQRLVQSASSTKKRFLPMPSSPQVQPLPSSQNVVPGNRKLLPDYRAAQSAHGLPGQSFGRSSPVIQPLPQVQSHEQIAGAQPPIQQPVYLTEAKFYQELVIPSKSRGWKLSCEINGADTDYTVSGPTSIVYMFSPEFHKGFRFEDEEWIVPPIAQEPAQAPVPATSPSRKRSAEEDIQEEAPTKKQKVTEENVSPRVTDLAPIPSAPEPEPAPALNDSISPIARESSLLPQPAAVPASPNLNVQPAAQNPSPTPALTPSKSTPDNVPSPLASPTPAASGSPDIAAADFKYNSNYNYDGSGLLGSADGTYAEAQQVQPDQAMAWDDYVHNNQFNPDDPFAIPDAVMLPDISSFGIEEGGEGHNEEDVENGNGNEAKCSFGDPCGQCENCTGLAFQTEPEVQGNLQENVQKN